MRAEPTSGAKRRWRWVSWLVGAAILGAVVITALNFSEQRAIVGLLERAEPAWLAWATLLQVATYFAQGETWRVVTRAAKFPVPIVTAFRLSLVKHFVDQAVPSAGISGTIVFAKALERYGVARSVVTATVAVETVSYYVAYLLALALAVVVAAAYGYASPLVIVVAVGFGAFAVVFGATVVALSGRKRTTDGWLGRVPVLKTALALLEQADRRLARSPRLILESAVFQLVIVALDAVTVWMLVRSLGASASLAGTFASFMISSLLRTVGVVPGGLGTFEAASVVTLRLAGLPVAEALSATLLFSGLSFWLPLVPGMLLSRRVVRDERGQSPERSPT